MIQGVCEEREGVLQHRLEPQQPSRLIQGDYHDDQDDYYDVIHDDDYDDDYDD